MLSTFVASVSLGVVGVALLAAGPVMVLRGCGGKKEIRTELAAQKITFPVERGLPDELTAYAGKPVRTGAEARAYADLIKVHLDGATRGRTYSELSDEYYASGSADEKLADLRQTAFMGESLRASLMSAYQAWQLTTLVVGLGALLTALGAALIASGAALGL
ncbi:hypothetical protein HNR23_002355 [Nocardiopsis mwathae]|uniref:Uncharacterized protein n=1 Tax=Nocardiopsis mwathae TaxID=1472723 RepID=A0A7X0D5J9_9ACTN|nr:hypothetical protein [Nocardiopsis mwathae]MBB6172295.1 hypothetical protein [Nocardiopsis mwathae]